MKVNVFEVTSRRVAILGWSVSLCVVFMLLQLSENMGSILMSLLQMGLALPIRHLRLRHCYGFVGCWCLFVRCWRGNSFAMPC